MNNVTFTVCGISREKEIAAIVEKNLEVLKQNRIRFTWPERPIEDEYNKREYKKHRTWLQEKWQDRGNEFTERLLIYFHQPQNLQFTVEVSNYGPLGFYNAGSNIITVNRNTHLDPIQTIKHELANIMLEPFARRYNLSFEQKERMADMVLEALSAV